MSESTYQLVLRKGPRPDHVYPLKQLNISLGRDPMSDIVVDDPEVSRHHARLTAHEDGYTLQDLGSTNGTFVSRDRLTGDPVTLKHGEIVSLGNNIAFEYQIIEITPEPKAFLPETDVLPEMPALSADPSPDEPNINAAPAALPTENERIQEHVDEIEAEADKLDDLIAAQNDVLSGEEIAAMSTELEPPAVEPASPPEIGTDKDLSFDDYSPQEEMPPPPPIDVRPRVGESGAPKRNNNVRNIIIIAVAALLSCCACMLVSYFWLGDWFLQQAGLIP